MGLGSAASALAMAAAAVGAQAAVALGTALMGSLGKACAAGRAGPSSGRSHVHGLDFVGASPRSEALPCCLMCP